MATTSLQRRSRINGNQFRINYKGKVNESEIKFTGEIPGMDRTFEFTAKKSTTVRRRRRILTLNRCVSASPR